MRIYLDLLSTCLLINRLTQCCVLIWSAKILMRAMSNVHAGCRFPTPASNLSNLGIEIGIQGLTVKSDTEKFSIIQTFHCISVYSQGLTNHQDKRDRHQHMDHTVLCWCIFVSTVCKIVCGNTVSDSETSYSTAKEDRNDC